MGLQITGKNIDIGDALRQHVEGRLDTAMEKYFGRGFSGHVMFIKEGHGFRTEIFLHLDSGQDLQSIANAGDAYASFDQAADRMETRLRRYKSKLRSHNGPTKAEGAVYASYVIEQPGDEDAEKYESYNPLVIAETASQLRSMPVSSAVLQLDLSGAPLFVFKNASHGGVNIVYRRNDGNIGWVDPNNAMKEAAE